MFFFFFFPLFSPPQLFVISIFTLLFSLLVLELYLHFSFFFLFFSSISSLHFSFFFFFSSTSSTYSRAFKKRSLSLSHTHKWVGWVPFFSSHHRMSSPPRLRWVSYALFFFLVLIWLVLKLWFEFVFWLRAPLILCFYMFFFIWFD